jgi:hypothetical protein
MVEDETAPLSWSLEKDVLWKVKVPGKGHASPVIWDDALFLVSADEESGERLLMRMDRKTGKHVTRGKPLRTGKMPPCLQQVKTPRTCSGRTQSSLKASLRTPRSRI